MTAREVPRWHAARSLAIAHDDLTDEEAAAAADAAVLAWRAGDPPNDGAA